MRRTSATAFWVACATRAVAQQQGASTHDCETCFNCVEKYELHTRFPGSPVPWCHAGFSPRSCSSDVGVNGTGECWCVDTEGAEVGDTRRGFLTGSESSCLAEASCAADSQFTGLDTFVLALYFVGVLAVGFWAFKGEQQKAEAKPVAPPPSAVENDAVDTVATAVAPQSGADDYFLAGRSMGWFPIGLSLFVSNIGSEHLVGLSGSAASSGLAVGFFEWHASFALLVLGWVCAPIYIHNRIATLPEYLERRYSPAARTVLAVTSLIAYVLSKLSVSVFSGATIAHVVFGIDKMVAAILLILITAVYTIFGGLTAVIMTDVAQSVVLLVGCIVILVVGLVSVGGMSGLRTTVPAGLSAEEYEGFWHMMRPADDPDYPWPGLYFGVNAIGLWYWCTDQAIAQRVLAARSLNHARAACLFAAVLKLTPVFIMCVPGIIARVLYGDCVAGENSNDTFALLIVRMLPEGLVGLLVAATLAAAMSSIDSVATAGASLFCLDIYRPFINPNANEKQLVYIGRLVIAAMAILTVIWLPIITVLSDQVFVYIQSVQAYLSPPIFVVYFSGILWKRANTKGAMLCLGLGYGLGFTRLLLEIIFKEWCAKPSSSGFFYAFICSNFLYFGLISLFFCVTAMIWGSLSSPPPLERQLSGLTFTSAMHGINAENARANELQMDDIGLDDSGQGEANGQDPADLATAAAAAATAARTSRELPLTAGQTEQSDADPEVVTAAATSQQSITGSDETCGMRWRQMERWGAANFETINLWGSIAVVVLLAILLVSYA